MARLKENKFHFSPLFHGHHLLIVILSLDYPFGNYDFLQVVKITFICFSLQQCQQDLASVLPILQQAIESLDSLDKADIAEIR